MYIGLMCGYTGVHGLCNRDNDWQYQDDKWEFQSIHHGPARNT